MSNPKCSSKDPNYVFLSVNRKSAIESLSRTAIRDLKLVLNECEGLESLDDPIRPLEHFDWNCKTDLLGGLREIHSASTTGTRGLMLMSLT